jgi:hypothetical protein
VNRWGMPNSFANCFPYSSRRTGDGHNLIVREEPEHRNVTITAPVPDPDDSNPNLSAAGRIHD